MPNIEPDSLNDLTAPLDSTCVVGLGPLSPVVGVDIALSISITIQLYLSRRKKKVLYHKGLISSTSVRICTCYSFIPFPESLPGVELMANYHFKFGRSSLYKMPVTINPTGCARSEPKMRTHFKK